MSQKLIRFDWAMKTKKYRISLLKGITLALMLTIMISVFMIACSQQKPTLKAQYKNLTEAVYASGNIVPQDEYKVFSLAEGYLAKKEVKEGDSISLNQILFVIESDRQNIRLNTSGETYNMAQLNYGANSPILKEAEVAVSTAQNKMENDALNFNRFKNLLERQATTQSEFDRVALAYKTSKNEYILQKSRYEKIKNQLYLELQNAKSQYQINATDEGDYAVRSKIKGMVYETYKEEGELIRKGEALALLGANHQMYIKLNIDELDIARIKVGQEVWARMDVFKNKIFKAKISKIYKMLNKSDQSFRVDAVFIDEIPANFSGLTVEANIIIRQKPKALVIPKSLLMAGDSIWVKKEGKEQKIKIKKGIENFDEVEVLEGINEQTVLMEK